MVKYQLVQEPKAHAIQPAWTGNGTPKLMWEPNKRRADRAEAQARQDTNLNIGLNSINEVNTISGGDS